MESKNNKVVKKTKKYIYAKLHNLTSNNTDISLNDIILNKNKKLFSDFKKKLGKEMIMYHITNKESAKSILLNGFDTSRSHRGAFGKGVNLSTNINHLKHYINKNNIDDNYIIKCIVKFNKLKKNKTLTNKNGEMLFVRNSKGNMLHSKPKYNTPPSGYNGLYVPGPEIYVIPTSQQVYPLLIGKINKDTFS